MDRIDPEVRAFVQDAVDFGRVGEALALPVAQHGAVLPACLPQFVNRLHVVLGHVVAVIVRPAAAFPYRGRRCRGSR